MSAVCIESMCNGCTLSIENKVCTVLQTAASYFNGHVKEVSLYCLTLISALLFVVIPKLLKELSAYLFVSLQIFG